MVTDWPVRMDSLAAMPTRAEAAPCSGPALRASVQGRRQQLADARGRLMHATPQTRVEQESQRLLSLWKRLQAASPASVLHRGFVIMRDEAGRPVMRRAEIVSGQRLKAEFADGETGMRAE